MHSSAQFVCKFIWFSRFFALYGILTSSFTSVPTFIIRICMCVMPVVSLSYDYAKYFPIILQAFRTFSSLICFFFTLYLFIFDFCFHFCEIPFKFSISFSLSHSVCLKAFPFCLWYLWQIFINRMPSQAFNAIHRRHFIRPFYVCDAYPFLCSLIASFKRVSVF